MSDRYLAAELPAWNHPDDMQPPLGTKLLIYTRGGVCVIGHWSRQEGAVLWAPLPKVSRDLRDRLEAETQKV
jgi:hypothetical protein